MNGGEDSQELVTKDLEHLGGLELFILSKASALANKVALRSLAAPLIA